MMSVEVPEGIAAGEAFLVVAPNGQEVTIECPEGCGAGDLLEVALPDDAPPSEQPTEPAVSEPQLVEIVIPDGCGEGDEFLVEFNGTQFSVGVPPGCTAGMAITIEVPAAPEAPADEPPAAEPLESFEKEDETSSALGKLSISEGERYALPDPPAFLGGGGSSDKHEPLPSKFGNPFDYSSDEDDKEPSIFAGGFKLHGEESKKCGDFSVDQLIQVTRSDGTWTYGKIMDYDEMGDSYTIMTKAGPKYMVDRADLTDNIVTNPSDGSCAHQ